MPAKRLPWVKLWIEAFAHEKIALLPDAEFRTWATVLALASNQPIRWRFASVQHAAAVTGRPLEQVRALIDARLLDECEDGLWIHDWKQWQDQYPSDHSANAPRTLREDSDNTPPNAPPTLPRARAKMGDRRREIGDRETGEVNSVVEEKTENVVHFSNASTLKGGAGGKRREIPESPFTSDEQALIARVSDTLTGWNFRADPRWWRKILDDYGRVDIEAEAFSMADWLKRHGKRLCSTGFVLNWLKKAYADLPYVPEVEPLDDGPVLTNLVRGDPDAERLCPGCMFADRAGVPCPTHAPPAAEAI